MLAFYIILDHSYYLIPVAVFGLILVNPCTPPFILSMSAGCSEISWCGWVILIPVLEMYLSLCFFYVGTASIVYNLFAGISSILNYFQLLDRYEIFPKVLST